LLPGKQKNNIFSKVSGGHLCFALSSNEIAVSKIQSKINAWGLHWRLEQALRN
jgi:hypothetical protein